MSRSLVLLSLVLSLAACADAPVPPVEGGVDADLPDATRPDAHVPDAGAAGDAETDALVDDATVDDAAVDDAAVPDLLQRLEALSSVTHVEELAPTTPGTRTFVLHVEQPVDHASPDGARFEQVVALRHRDHAAPMVLEPTGYRRDVTDRPAEPTTLLDANQLVVEHRFYGASRPAEPIPWAHLTIDQAAHDVHRIVEIFRALYPGPWVSTGVSKGGMTAVFHHTRFPGDLDGTIAYAAPFSLALEDERYLAFFDTVGTEACRQRLRDLGRELLLRRPAIEAEAAAWAPIDFDVLGFSRAYEASVRELPWSFWQSFGHHATACDRLPAITATDETLVSFLEDLGLLVYYADAVLVPLEPYHFQVAHEIGGGAVSDAHLADLLVFDHDALLDDLLPEGSAPMYDPSAMEDTLTALTTDAESVELLYGANDPWTAGRVVLDAEADARGVHVTIAAGADHGVSIAALPEADRLAICGRIEAFTEVPAVTCAARAEALGASSSARARQPASRR